MKNLILTGGIFHPFEKSSEAIYKLFLKEGIDSGVDKVINYLNKKKHQDVKFKFQQ